MKEIKRIQLMIFATICAAHTHELKAPVFGEGKAAAVEKNYTHNTKGESLKNENIYKNLNTEQPDKNQADQTAQQRAQQDAAQINLTPFQRTAIGARDALARLNPTNIDGGIIDALAGTKYLTIQPIESPTNSIDLQNIELNDVNQTKFNNKEKNITGSVEFDPNTMTLTLTRNARQGIAGRNIQGNAKVLDINNYAKELSAARNLNNPDVRRKAIENIIDQATLEMTGNNNWFSDITIDQQSLLQDQSYQAFKKDMTERLNNEMEKNRAENNNKSILNFLDSMGEEFKRLVSFLSARTINLESKAVRGTRTGIQLDVEKNNAKALQIAKENNSEEFLAENSIQPVSNASSTQTLSKQEQALERFISRSQNKIVSVDQVTGNTITTVRDQFNRPVARVIEKLNGEKVYEAATNRGVFIEKQNNVLENKSIKTNSILNTHPAPPTT